jgi:hypothetical protein
MDAIIKNNKEGKPTTDQRKLNVRSNVQKLAFITNVATDIKKHWRVTVRKLDPGHGVWRNTIHNTLHKALNLSKKSARWVPKLLIDEMKLERVRISEAFLAMILCRSKAMLGSYVTMDKATVLFCTPETKEKSMQWLKKGESGPIKAKVHATRAKQMVLSFSYNKSLIYTNDMPRGTMVNVDYIMEALRQLHEDFQDEEAHDSRGRMNFPLGQCSGPHCHCWH